MNERNVCIGDIISVGSEVLLQVSLPRSPCFKLNHRFSIKNFAPITYQTSRTGWYYRVIREGTVRVGDQLKLVERKWPTWTIERIQEYLHRNTNDLPMNEALAAVDVLGNEARNQFQNRVVKAKKRREKEEEVWRDFKVTSRRMETPRIVSLRFEAVVPVIGEEEAIRGSHVKLKLPNGLTRSYSIVSGTSKDESLSSFDLGIALGELSRGGSQYIHKSVHPGDIIQVGKPTAALSAAKSASNHVFIAGGIGITAFLAMIERYHAINFNYTLHYAIRSSGDLPFQDQLKPFHSNTIFYDKSQGQRMDVAAIVKNLTWNSHLYVCGPDSMMEATKSAVEECGLAPDEVHYEAFAADISGDPFEAEVVNRNGRLLKVAEQESLLDVLRREFPEVPSSCEVGNCGTCKISLSCGQVDHRGTALTTEEQKKSMLACVSRGIGRITIEI
jgi:ferredoxin-NADP reductase